MFYNTDYNENKKGNKESIKKIIFITLCCLYEGDYVQTTKKAALQLL